MLVFLHMYKSYSDCLEKSNYLCTGLFVRSHSLINTTLHYMHCHVKQPTLKQGPAITAGQRKLLLPFVFVCFVLFLPGPYSVNHPMLLPSLFCSDSHRF